MTNEEDCSSGVFKGLLEDGTEVSDMWKVDTVRLLVEREKLWVDLCRDLGQTMMAFD